MGNKLLIIQPSHYHSKQNRTVFKTRRRSLVPLALPYLAAITSPEWDVALIDEQIQDIDFDCRPDLVAITSWTVHSIRGYDVAREFRNRGIPVIMGDRTFGFTPRRPPNTARRLAYVSATRRSMTWYFRFLLLSFSFCWFIL